MESLEFKGLTRDEKLIRIFSFYRDAELRGARLLFNLVGHMKDRDGQVKISKHLADETRHAWLWTKRIADLGGMPLPVEDGYQRRLGLRAGVPRTLVDLLALTVVVEERAQSRYNAHLALPDVDQETRDVLQAVMDDESWHLAWIEDKMRDVARAEGNEGHADVVLEKYRAIDREVYAQLAQDEAELMRS
jgi:bacterioferritin (cytochrome b1)